MNLPCDNVAVNHDIFIAHMDVIGRKLVLHCRITRNRITVRDAGGLQQKRAGTDETDGLVLKVP